MRLNRVPQALEAAERALEIAEPLNLVRIVADAMNNRAATLINIGRRREATALIRAALELAVDGGWVDLELRLRNNLAVTIADDDPAGATAAMREVHEISERIGNVMWYLVASAAASGADYLEGRDWDAAQQLAEEALGRAAPGSWSWVQLTTSLLQLRAARGEGVEDLEAALDSTEYEEALRFWVEQARADVALSRGDFAAAVRHGQAVLDSGQAESNEPSVRSNIGYGQIALGEPDGARTTADVMRDGVFQGPLSKAFQALVDAGALALEGRANEARQRFTDGVAAMRALDQPFEVARWQILAVQLLPDAPEAPTWAEEARQLVERLGSRSACPGRCRRRSPPRTGRGSTPTSG
jgi:tetratricopeptide (TPR) repeat protein